MVDYLFCNLSAKKHGFKVRIRNRKMSYSNLRELFLEVLSPHVVDAKNTVYIPCVPVERVQLLIMTL